MGGKRKKRSDFSWIARSSRAMTGKSSRWWRESEVGDDGRSQGRGWRVSASGVTTSTFRPRVSSRRKDTSMKLSKVCFSGINSTRISMSLESVCSLRTNDPNNPILVTPKNESRSRCSRIRSINSSLVITLLANHKNNRQPIAKNAN